MVLPEIAAPANRYQWAVVLLAVLPYFQYTVPAGKALG